jgi:hypothetical protein
VTGQATAKSPARTRLERWARYAEATVTYDGQASSELANNSTWYAFVVGPVDASTPLVTARVTGGPSGEVEAACAALLERLAELGITVP